MTRSKAKRCRLSKARRAVQRVKRSRKGASHRKYGSLRPAFKAKTTGKPSDELDEVLKVVVPATYATALVKYKEFKQCKESKERLQHFLNTQYPGGVDTRGRDRTHGTLYPNICFQVEEVLIRSSPNTSEVSTEPSFPIPELLSTSNEFLNPPEPNSVFLWHGTKANNISSILDQGFHNASRAAYGPGVYLTPDFGKADEYAETTRGYDDEGSYNFMLGVQDTLLQPVSVYPSKKGLVMIVTKKRDGSPVRWKEVIVKDPNLINVVMVVRYTSHGC